MAAYYRNNNYRNRNRSREQYTVNEQITAPEVRVVSEGENLGVQKTKDAIQMAKDREKDLVLIAEKAKPPVAKIIELSKYKYQEQQKKQKAKAKSKKQDLKQFRVGVNTGENDVKMRVDRARKFLQKKDKVRFSLRFRGRENAHRELGFERLNDIAQQLSDVAKPESDLKLQGNELVLTLIPE